MGSVTGYNEANKSPNSDMAYQIISFYGNDNWKVNNKLNIEIGARLEHVGHWYDRTGNGMAVFYASRVASDYYAGKAEPGFYWKGIARVYRSAACRTVWPSCLRVSAWPMMCLETARRWCAVDGAHIVGRTSTTTMLPTCKPRRISGNITSQATQKCLQSQIGLINTPAGRGSWDRASSGIAGSFRITPPTGCTTTTQSTAENLVHIRLHIQPTTEFLSPIVGT